MATAHDVKLSIFAKRVDKFIENLFIEAFNSGNDCFFWQVLLNLDLRGMGYHPILESEDWAFYQSLTDLIEKQEDLFTKIRLSMMVYCHLYENSLLPKMFRNLFMVINNDAPNLGLFPLHGKKEQSPEWKYKSVYEYSKNDEFNNLIKEIYIPDIRHAFSHSDYVLMPYGLVTKPERNMASQVVDYDDLQVMLYKMFIFYQIFMETWDKYRKTLYKHGDFIRGIPNLGYQNIEIINDGKSMGFQSGNAAADQASGDYLETRKKNKPIMRMRIKILIGYVYNRPSYFNILPFLPRTIANCKFVPLHTMRK